MDHTLRLYSNPFKQSLYLLGALAFVAAGVLILHDPTSDAGTVIMGYIAVGFFGLCGAVFLFSMARDLLTRHPLLQVNTQGWSYISSLGVNPQHVSWEDIGRIALYRQRLSRNKMFYLVLEARHPEAQPPSRLREMAASLYPSMSLVVMSIPLNTAFIRTTPAKVERLLQRIQTEFPGELHSYGIVVDDAIHDM